MILKQLEIIKIIKLKKLMVSVILIVSVIATTQRIISLKLQNKSLVVINVCWSSKSMQFTIQF